MKFGTLVNGGLVLGALSGLWLAPACSGGSSGGGSFVEQACGSICTRSSKARDALGCSTGEQSTCYQDCVQQSLHCSPDKLGALSDCVGPLDDSDFVCSGNEAVVSSGCSAENSAYQSSCSSNSGGTTGSGGASGSGGKGGSSGSSSGGVGGTIAGSSGTANGGTGGTVTQYCTGTPYPCSYFSGAECSTQFGCVGTTGCSGPQRYCSDWDGYELDCSYQIGCTYDVASGFCDGVPAYCDELIDSTTCYSQYNCTWSDTCTGTPYSCSTFPADGCIMQDGCYVQ